MPSSLVELLEHGEHFPAGAGVKVARGSSANSIEGRLTRARAMATRCCWPPESCEGS